MHVASLVPQSANSKRWGEKDSIYPFSNSLLFCPSVGQRSITVFSSLYLQTLLSHFKKKSLLVCVLSYPLLNSLLLLSSSWVACLFSYSSDLFPYFLFSFPPLLSPSPNPTPSLFLSPSHISFMFTSLFYFQFICFRFQNTLLYTPLHLSKTNIHACHRKEKVSHIFRLHHKSQHHR